MKKTFVVLLIVLLLILSGSCAKAPLPTETPQPTSTATPDLAPTATPDPFWTEIRMTELAGKYGITAANYPKIDGSTSTLPIVQLVFSAMYNTGFGNTPSYPETASQTVPSYEKLIQGEVDLIIVPYASRDVFAQADEAGVTLSFTPIVAEALVMITPAENPVDNITKEQVREIYLNYGIKNWSALDGPDRALIPLCRNTDSGSQSQMDNLILDGQPMYPDIVENYIHVTMPGIILETASWHTGGFNRGPSNSYALGYTLFTYFNWYVKEFEQNDAKMMAFDGVEPTEESIAQGTYPLTTAYYAVVRKDLPADHAARRIIDFLQGPDAKQVLEQSKFTQLPPGGVDTY